MAYVVVLYSPDDGCVNDPGLRCAMEAYGPFPTLEDARDCAHRFYDLEPATAPHYIPLIPST